MSTKHDETTDLLKNLHYLLTRNATFSMGLFDATRLVQLTTSLEQLITALEENSLVIFERENEYHGDKDEGDDGNDVPF